MTVLSLLVPVLILGGVEPAGAAYTAPRYVRSIGGMGRPGVFAWGVQWNPVSNEMLVGDYLHFKVRRYDLAGNHLGDFWNDGDCGQPYTVGVDPRDGAVYVAELKDNPFRHCIAKYDVAGNFLYRIAGSGSGGADSNQATLGVYSATSTPRAFYPVWMTVEEDTGDIFILDSHYTNKNETDPPEMLQMRFDDATKKATVVAEWPVYPPELPLGADCTNPVGCAPRIYGVDIVTAPGSPDDDVIYMTDAWNRRAYRYSKTGTWLSTFAQTQTGGDNRGVAVNEALDRVYIVDAEHSDIDMYTMAGTYAGSFANAGGEAGEFSGGGRQIDLDGAGNVWAADFGGFETEKYTPTGTPLLTAPTPARKPPVGLLGQPRDVAVDKDTGEVWVADSWNQRFQRFSPTGASMGAWGQRGPGGPFQMNYPRSIAVQKRADGSKRIWLSNERGHHLQVYNYPTTATGSPTYVAQIGQIGRDDTDLGHFRWPVDIEFYNRPASGCAWCDGRQIAVIGDRMAASIKILDAETFEELLMIPDLGLATAVDPATGLIYSLRGTTVRIYDQAGTLLGTFGSSGTGDGQFRDTTDAVFANGVVYITDEVSSRVSAWVPAANPTQDPANPNDDLTATYLGRWGSTYGPNIYDFKGAIGIDADAQGRVYVTDSGNDRIQVFDPALAKVAESVNPPTPVVSQPSAAAANLTTLGPVTLSGTATDDTAMGNVEISVQDYTTGLWWNASNQSWEANQTNSIAAYSASNVNNVSWRWVFLGVSAQGRYVVMVKSRDHNGNLSQPVMRTFAMPGATAPPVPPAPLLDTARPNGLEATPTANQVFPRAAVTFTGTGTDNVGVTSVRIAIKRLSDGRWLS
ncbi:MAG TPA: NHL repeat-containing protein, partial [Acidimicrobiia bacterium]